MITKEALVTTPEKSKEVKSKIGNKETLFEWVVQIDQYGPLNLLEERFGTGAGTPAFTVAEMLDLLPPMSTFTFLLFCLRTRLKPDAVANYLISKL